MNWFDIIKSPYPNHMTNRKGRGGRRIIRGSGQGGLFRYDELTDIDSEVQPLVDEAYNKEIEKLVEFHIKQAKKQLKKEGGEFTSALENWIRKRVVKNMEKQKKRNLYATYYGSHTKKGPWNQSKGKWFHGRIPALGVNPDDKERIGALLRTVHGAAKHAGVGWDKPAPKKERKVSEEEE